jgi:hypothetical protein
VDGIEHRRGVNGLIVETGEELGYDQAEESSIFQSIGRLKSHTLHPTENKLAGAFLRR